jgi:hypothetical protein
MEGSRTYGASSDECRMDLNIGPSCRCLDQADDLEMVQVLVLEGAYFTKCVVEFDCSNLLCVRFN